MTFGFTRDSKLFYLSLGAVIVGYFAAAETSPDQWTFKEWCQFALVPIGWLIGKLQTSPLQHSELGGAKITREDIAAAEVQVVADEREAASRKL